MLPQGKAHINDARTAKRVLKSERQSKSHGYALPCPELPSLKGVVQMILKCADIGHLAAAPRTHRRWAYQLEEEFFRQVISAVEY